MLRNAGVIISFAAGIGMGWSLLLGDVSAAEQNSPSSVQAVDSAQSDAVKQARENKPTLSPEQALDQAVAIARKGDNKRALVLLNQLIEAHPDFYPARRDFIVIASWDNQCELAWRRFQQLKSEAQYEDYLVSTLAECLRDMRRFDDARDLIDAAKKRNPDNEGIRNASSDLQEQLYWRNLPLLSVNIGGNNSDQGGHEWHLETRYSHPLSSANRVYARYLLKRATDPQFETGNMNRVGAGLQSWLSDDDMIDAELSTDVKKGQQQGARLAYNHLLGRRWQFGAEYANYYEDLSLRATAKDISANNAGLSAEFHSLDYRYEWSASASRSRFTDGNLRRSAQTGVGYAFMLKPQREYRVLLDLYQANNSLAGTDYYNPEHDFSATLSLRADLVLDSDFERHAHNLTLYVGQHDQRHYDNQINFGARYGIDLQMTRQSGVNFAAEYGRASYDGNQEYEGSLDITFSRKFK